MTDLIIPTVQRALVLQGGGAPGAYQAGAFKGLYEKLRKMVVNDNDVPLFDIIAGTSIGAINGAILVSYFVENKTWDGASENLRHFGKYLSTPTPKYSRAVKAVEKRINEKGKSLSSIRRICTKILFNKRIY